MLQPKYFTVEQDGDAVIFTAMGSLGMLVEDAVREEWNVLLEEIEFSQSTHAVIDLNAVDYFGSIMLELLVVLWKRVSAKNGKLALCHVSTVGKEILATAKFDTLWEVLDDREQALTAVRN